jgi:alkylhydroperoxidase/carboxymuconolactone decarboxylase family protein YurZ
VIPSITAVRLTGARDRVELPLLVLGPCFGASATELWSRCASALADSFDLLAWDLPGHGHNRTVPDEPFTGAELAEGVLRVVDDVLAERGEAGGRFLYAGDGAGGDVGLQLVQDRADRVAAAVLLRTDGGDRLAEAVVPVLEVAGPHPSPADDPDEVAALLRRHFLGEDAAVADLTGRPGLDPRSRSLVALAALVASGRLDELPAQVRTARSHGLTADEVEEVVLQTAVHGGDPTATAALGVARRALSEESGAP